MNTLKKKLDNSKGKWVSELPSILWSYRTTARTSTGETPFSLVYGAEAMIPAEIGINQLVWSGPTKRRTTLS